MDPVLILCVLLWLLVMVVATSLDWWTILNNATLPQPDDTPKDEELAG